MSQELPSALSVRSYTKKRAEKGKEQSQTKKGKAGSDDDTRDSGVEAPAVKEAVHKEEAGGYGTEPDRESPTKAPGSPDLAPDDDLLNVRH